MIRPVRFGRLGNEMLDVITSVRIQPMYKVFTYVAELTVLISSVMYIYLG